MSESITTGNRFEAAYYVAWGCGLDAVSFREENGQEWAYFSFRPEGRLAELKAAYRAEEALVNLHRFKEAYRQLGIYVSEAKKRGKHDRSTPHGGTQ